MSVKATYTIDTDLWDTFKNKEEDLDTGQKEEPNNEFGLYCYHCKSDNLVTENSIVTCRSCGTINNNILDC